jgi:hypothetical protein
MGNIISLLHCCNCKTRPASIFGKPKNYSKKSLHIAKPLIPTNNIYSTTPPYFIEDKYVI